ncbi:Uncharacterised protein [Pandoraea pulmonicola]|uniref:Uncharacterized protein n=1 Tax=Pandoraea pulmonicola TaxID=93221 RepID=A0AAJ5D0X5_PANPU|nr:Uncharacterised protein [Pandoraea pulmonicola]
MLTCGASGAPLFSPSVRVTAGYRGEERGDNKRENAHRQKGSAVGENSNSAFYIALRHRVPTASCCSRPCWLRVTSHPPSFFASAFAAAFSPVLSPLFAPFLFVGPSISRHAARIVSAKYAQCGLKTLCSPFCYAIRSRYSAALGGIGRHGAVSSGVLAGGSGRPGLPSRVSAPAPRVPFLYRVHSAPPNIRRRRMSCLLVVPSSSPFVAPADERIHRFSRVRDARAGRTS